MECLIHRALLYWGCYAAQRGASPLATTSSLATKVLSAGRSALCRSCVDTWPSWCTWGSIWEWCGWGLAPDDGGYLHNFSDLDTSPCGERACPALGCEAAPKPAAMECLIHRALLYWGCYAAQRGASPLATTSSLATTVLSAGRSALCRSCVDTWPSWCTWGSTWEWCGWGLAPDGGGYLHNFSDPDTSPCGERACPALGCEAAPKPAARECLIHRALLYWGCYAAQRGASPLATTSSLATTVLSAGRSALCRSCVDTWPSWCTWGSIWEWCGWGLAPDGGGYLHNFSDPEKISLWRAGLPRVGLRSSPKASR